MLRQFIDCEVEASAVIFIIIYISTCNATVVVFILVQIILTLQKIR
jgi:hypothetical protein